MLSPRAFILFLTGVLFSLLSPYLAKAEIVIAPYLEVELVSEFANVAPKSTFQVALRFKPEAGWHIYWKYAGDSGSAPKFEWTLNGQKIEPQVAWPTPQRIPFGHLVNYGYEQETLLIAEFTAPSTPGMLKIAVDAEWLVCQEECIPGNGILSLTLPVNESPSAPTQWAKHFSATRAEWPVARSDFAASSHYENGSYFINFPPPPRDEKDLSFTFFPDTPGVIENASPQVLTFDGKEYHLELKKDVVTEKPSSVLSGVLTSSVGWGPQGVPRSIELGLKVSGVAAPQASTPLPTSESYSVEEGGVGFVPALFFAFLGGLILNLMPCVFPILSIKVLGFVQCSEEEFRTRALHAGLFAFGVVASFWLLSGIIYAVQASGSKLGWGFQLQNPTFVAGMALLMIAIGLNLLGAFEFGASIQHACSKVKHSSSSNLGAFSSGVLATLLATPCTAPFMGGALAYALTLPSYQGFLIFTALGLGMALPYVLFSLSPKLVSYLPRPGNWMVIFKQFMAFPMFATAIWLIWVLNLQAGSIVVLQLLWGALLLSFALWLYGKMVTPLASRARRVAFSLISFACVILSIFVSLPGDATIQNRENISQNTYTDHFGQKWELFTPAKLAELRSAGKAIYLDFTAAWCITCQVNKQVVFSSDEVRTLVKEKGVILMRGDWTTQDSGITAALASFGRRGVPLNVLFSGRETAPHIFPSLLSAGIVLEELRKLPN